MQQTIYALLVGIDHYASPTVPNLGGCVNDVTAMATLLQSHFGVPAANLVTLLNDQATYDAVKFQFRQHLLEAARTFATQNAARDQLQPPPAILFHFSGHGSQAPDPTGQEPDGFDETLVCHDSRLSDVYDLKDWELGQLLDELAQYTDNITVILDCCHAGSGTRSETKVVSNTRSCFPDLRPQPITRPGPRATTTVLSPTALSHPAPADQPQQLRRSGTVGRSADPVHHWARGRSNHVLLAACRDQEKALEYIPTSDSGLGSSTAQRRHGVLTHYLIPLLEKLDTQQLPTYRELYEQLCTQVMRAYPQTPQCEGDWGRLLFGGSRPDRDLWLTVQAEQEGRYSINGGLAHGLAVGTRLHAYPPTARTLDAAGPLLGLLQVVEAGAVRSDCVVLSQTAPIPLHARLALVDAGAQRKRVAVEISSGMIAGAVRERLAQADLAGLVALLPAGSASELRVALVNEALEVQDGDGCRLGQPYPLRALNRMRRPLRAADLDPVAQDLQRIVRAQRLDLLHNADSELANALTLRIKRLIDLGPGAAPLAGDLIASTAAPSATAPAVLQVDEPFVVEVTNVGEEALYVALLLRRGAWSVTQIYPEVRGAQEQLFPQRTLSIGLAADPARQLRLPPRRPAPHEATVHETINEEEVTFLLIGTVAEADFEAFLQQEEAVAAAALARHEGRSAFGQRVMRSFKLGGAATAADEWMTVQLQVRLRAG